MIESIRKITPFVYDLFELRIINIVWIYIITFIIGHHSWTCLLRHAFKYSPRSITWFLPFLFATSSIVIIFFNFDKVFLFHWHGQMLSIRTVLIHLYIIKVCSRHLGKYGRTNRNAMETCVVTVTWQWYWHKSILSFIERSVSWMDRWRKCIR